MINTVVAFATCGMPVVYFMLFGGISHSLLVDIGISEGNFFGSEDFAIIILGLLMYYFIIQKQIEEIKVASISLFVGIIGFALILFIKLVAGMEDPEPFPEDESIIWPEFSSFETWACFSSILLAYSF